MDYILILKQRLLKLQIELIRLIPEILMAALAFVIFLFFSRLVRKYTNKYILRRTEDILLANFLANTFFFVILILGVVTSLGILGFSGTVTKILAGAGISGFIIGFAFKDIGENFLAGILLAFKRPFSIGDTIETNGLTGTVYDFKLRETLIKTADGIDAFIPNSIIIKNILKNHTLDHLLRKEFIIGVDYRDDVDRAIEVIRGILNDTEEIEKESKEPVVIISDFGEKYATIKVLFWLNTSFNGAKVQSRIMERTLDALKTNNYNLERK